MEKTSVNKSATHSFVDTFLGYQLRRVSSQVMASISENLAALELRVTETTILFEISAAPHITSSEIGRVLGIKRANMTPLVARLVEQGYIEMTAIDGRSHGLTLTEKGHKVFEQAKKICEEHEQSFFQALSPQEREDLHALLIKVFNSQQTPN